MKVSKPVLIFAIVVLLIAGYIFFFTGKKKTPPRAPAARPASAQVQTAPGQATVSPPPSSVQIQSAGSATTKSNQPEATSPAVKPDFDKLKAAWARNPFILPHLKEEKSGETTPAVRLFAILEKGKDKVAIIDHEIVRKGDMVGNEKVLEIESDKVILIRNGVKRVLDLADFRDQTAEETKTKATEKGK